MSVLALSWILRKRLYQVLFITEQASRHSLKSNLAAADFRISKDALDEIEKILDFKKFERHVG